MTFLVMKSLTGKDVFIDESGTFTGIASTDDVDYGGDVVANGSIKWDQSQLPPLLFNHDPAEVVGVISALEWQSDGLHVSGQLALEVPKAAELYSLIRRGAAVRGISVGMVVNKTAKRSDGVRVILDAWLHEVSIVAMPANRNAKISEMKSANSVEEQKLIEALRSLKNISA